MDTAQYKVVHDLTEGSISQRLWRFSLPFMLSNLLQISYNLIDMVVVGHYVGSTGLSAVSCGADIMHLATTICMGLSSAGQILISQYIGAKKPEGVKKTIGTLCTFLTVTALVVAVAGLASTKGLIGALSVPSEAVYEAELYSAICFLGMVFIFGYNFVSAILRGMGDSKRPFYFIAIASISNLALDLLFVAGFDMGVMGAALATVLGQAISFVISVVFLYKIRAALGFSFTRQSFAMDGPTLKALLALGIPIALQSSAISISKLFVNSWVNAFGLIASTVNGIGNKISQAGMIVAQALSTAGTSVIGQNFSAGKMDRVQKTVYISLLWGGIFVAALSAIMLLFPEQVFGLFTSDAQVLAMARDYAIIAVLNYVAAMLRSPMTGLMSGVGNAALGMFLGIMDGVVGRIALAMLLGHTLGLGIMGFWYGNVIAGFIPFIGGSIYFFSGLWKKRRLAIV